MSTSPKLAPARAPEASRPATAATLAATSAATAAMESFPYEVVSPGDLRRASGLYPFPELEAGGPHADDAARREAQARAQGREEGLAQSRHAFDEQLSRERLALSEALAGFTRDRAAYFETIEGEVVELALAIARKILHREAQVDPLLLAGIVRVALEKIEGATGVRLRVNPQNAADWRRYLATHLDPSDLPEIIEDAAEPVDRCTLETSMGTATVGLEVQLKEIEQGLMDLLAARPGVTR